MKHLAIFPVSACLCIFIFQQAAYSASSIQEKIPDVLLGKWGTGYNCASPEFNFGEDFIHTYVDGRREKVTKVEITNSIYKIYSGRGWKLFRMTDDGIFYISEKRDEDFWELDRSIIKRCASGSSRTGDGRR